MIAIDFKPIILDAIYKSGIITRDEYEKIFDKLTVDCDTQADYNIRKTQKGGQMQCQSAHCASTINV